MLFQEFQSMRSVNYQHNTELTKTEYKSNCVISIKK